MSRDDIFTICLTTLIFSFVLVGGYLIGSSVSGNDQRIHNERMDCLDRGGSISYDPNIGEICKK